VEIAGQAGQSAAGLRAAGASARVFAPLHPLRYQPDPDIVAPSGRVVYLRAAATAALASDVVHFHYGLSFVAGHLDVRLLRAAGRRVVVEFHGSEIRRPALERERNPFYVQLQGEDDETAEALLRTWTALTDGHAIISDPALARFAEPYFAHIHSVPLRIDCSLLEPAPPRAGAQTGALRAVHSPSDLPGKGTRHVRAAVERLRAGGAPLDYVEVHGMAQAEARAVYASADLVIDQLCSGSHGVFAIEAMAMAKPVISYIGETSRAAYPQDLPVINADPTTIEAVLGEWIEPSAPRHERGLAGRAYVERVHDARAVAPRLLAVYAQLPSRRRWPGS